MPNPQARLREIEIARQVAVLNLQQGKLGLTGHQRGRWDAKEKQDEASEAKQ